MRKILKFFHTLAAGGIIGSLLGSFVIIFGALPNLNSGESATAEINRLSQYVLLPSLAIVLVTGLLSMAVHRPFQETRWAWLKALLGLCMFEAVLAVVASAADAERAAMATSLTRQDPDHLMIALLSIRYALWPAFAIALVNVVLGVWRPRLSKFQIARPPQPRL